MSLFLTAMIFGLAAVVVVSGFVTGAWMGGLIYAVVSVGLTSEWLALRRNFPESREAADRLFAGVFVLFILLALPALESLESLMLD